MIAAAPSALLIKPLTDADRTRWDAFVTAMPEGTFCHRAGWQRVIERAEGDASRFKQIVAEYNKAPGVTRDRLYLDAMQEIMTNSSKVLVDQKGGNNLLYLPLDKLMQMATPAAAPPVDAMSRPADASPGAESPAAAAGRSRDALRSRDRESRQ